MKKFQPLCLDKSCPFIKYLKLSEKVKLFVGFVIEFQISFHKLQELMSKAKRQNINGILLPKLFLTTYCEKKIVLVIEKNV